MILEILNTLRKIFSILPYHRKGQILLLLFSMPFFSLIEVMGIGMTVPFLGALTNPSAVYDYLKRLNILVFFDWNNPQQIILPMVLSFCVSVSLAAFARITLIWFQTRLSYSIGAQLSVKMYENLLFQDYEYHTSKNSSALISNIAVKSGSVINNALYPSMVIINSVFMMSIILASLLYINPYLGIYLIIGFGGVYGIVMLMTRKIISSQSKKISIESDRVIAILQEGLGGVRDVLVGGLQQYFLNLYQASEFSLRKSIGTVNIISSVPRYIIELIGMIFFAIYAYYLTLDGVSFVSAIPVLGAVILGAQRILPILQQTYVAWVSIASGKNSVIDAVKILDLPSINNRLNATLPIKNEFNGIKFKNVSFRYSKDDAWILKDISLHIHPGQRIGIIGKTGSGKSTLMDVMMGLLMPTLGSVEIFGMCMNSSVGLAWRKKIAHVPQSIYLSDASIAENIAFGEPLNEIDISKVLRVAKDAHLLDLINGLPSEYMTKVGERGIRLSGGERQRVGIARALYKGADVIMFDEATSALDVDTEKDVMDSVNDLSRDLTIIIVAHRISTLEQCDVIFEVDSSKISWVGSYGELLTRIGKNE